MRPSPDGNKRKAKAITFGIDKAPPERPWRESRLVCAPFETHVYVDETGTRMRAEIHDVSRSGLRLVMDQPIPVGTAVKVQFTGMIASGEIRFCKPRGEGFEAGMRIDSTQKLG